MPPAVMLPMVVRMSMPTWPERNCRPITCTMGVRRVRMRAWLPPSRIGRGMAIALIAWMVTMPMFMPVTSDSGADRVMTGVSMGSTTMVSTMVPVPVIWAISAADSRAIDRVPLASRMASSSDSRPSPTWPCEAGSLTVAVRPVDAGPATPRTDAASRVSMDAGGQAEPEEVYLRRWSLRPSPEAMATAALAQRPMSTYTPPFCVARSRRNSFWNSPMAIVWITIL